MANRIIILDKLEIRRQSFRVVFWAVVPVTRQPFYADPNKVSVFKNATPAELADLKNGVVVESVETPSTGTTKTIPQIKALLQIRWQKYQDKINARNPWASEDRAF